MIVPACNAHGTNVRSVASRMGVSAMAIYQWREVPVDRVLQFCAALDWKVTPNEVRPDFYPNPADGLPAGHAARCPCECAAQQKAQASA